MKKDDFKPRGKLRTGWTTGACATAAAKAAASALMTGDFTGDVSIKLPGGEVPKFSLSYQKLEGNAASAGVIKDAGDDPDITHGAEVVATVRQGVAGKGVIFKAGEGVGMVTLPGLPVAVGEPAINPSPRKMIKKAVQEVAEAHGHTADFEITVSIPGGVALAEKTMNGRLGIVGGLSVLGTTGIVKPYSCSAWIHSIHSGIDVARATGLTHVAAATGKTSESAIKELYGLENSALIDMGDFIGGLLKYLRQHPMGRLTIAGGFAKLSKLAQGHMDLHSARSELDFTQLADSLKELGCDEGTYEVAKEATTAMAVLDLARARDLSLADLIASRARDKALGALNGDVQVEVCIFDRSGNLAGRAKGWENG